MKTRLLTSLAIVITIALLFVLKVYVSPYFFDFFFMIVAAVAAFELSKLLSRSGYYNNLIVAMCFPALIITANLLGFYFELNLPRKLAKTGSGRKGPYAPKIFISVIFQ